MDPVGTDCACATSQLIDYPESIGTLELIRAACPVLRLVLLPDEIWGDFKAWHSQPDSVAAHRSMILLAFERGHLHRLTSSIHRHLFKGSNLVARQQYKNDLKERWMHYADPLERHRKSRIFNGRITELQCAEWLEDTGAKLLSLEAVHGGPDIVAEIDKTKATHFEVKSIGTEDSDFGDIAAALAGEPSGGSVSAYSGLNYLLFRVYEAAQQLADLKGPRIVLVVIDGLTWWRFDMQLKNGWIDWTKPKFFDDTRDWKEFLQLQAPRYPNLISDLGPVIGTVDEVWILRRSSGYEYHLEYKLNTRGS